MREAESIEGSVVKANATVSGRLVRRELKDALEGKTPWNVWLGHGSFVVFDFGERVPSGIPSRPENGVDCLWIYYSSWRLFGSGIREAGSIDDRPAMQAAVALCIGQTVRTVRFDGDLNLSLEFAAPSMTFRTFRHSADSEAWLLYRQDYCYVLEGDGTFRRERLAKKLAGPAGFGDPRRHDG